MADEGGKQPERRRTRDSLKEAGLELGESRSLPTPSRGRELTHV